MHAWAGLARNHSFLDGLMDVIISLGHCWILSVCSISCSHDDSIQEWTSRSLHPAFDVTWLRASPATLSFPFWYSMLKVNLGSNSTHQCWVPNKLGVVMMSVSTLLSFLTVNGFQSKYSWNCSAITHFNAKHSCFIE